MSFAPIRNAFQEWTAPYRDEFSASWRGGGDWKKPLAPNSNLLIVDLVETGKDYQIIADAPGVEPADLEVNLNENVVNIKADRKNTFQADVDKLHLVERTYGPTTRNIQLPKDADTTHNNITFKNGVLRIVFPKLPGQPPIEQKKLSITHE